VEGRSPGALTAGRGLPTVPVAVVTQAEEPVPWMTTNGPMLVFDLVRLQAQPEPAEPGPAVS